jgi:hypothetical protein
MSLVLRGSAAALLCALSVGPAAAQASFPFWIGRAGITAVTSQCANGGFVAVGNVFESSYRAKTGVAGEPSNPGIMFLNNMSAYMFFRANNATSNANTMAGTGAYTGMLFRGNVTSIPNPSQQSYTGTSNLTIVTPASITSSTDSIVINGSLTNWRNVTGCTVTFKAGYRKGS